MTETYRERYEKQLEEGMEYQDFVADHLLQYGIVLNAYASKKWQLKKGESASGIEIKHDMRFNGEDGKPPTGNLYIEVAEKSNPANYDYYPSGIFRKDNTWLYLIGDYEEAFLFAKNQLITIYADKANYKTRGIREVITATSIGFIYPVEQALKGMCIKHFLWKGKR